MAAADEQYPTVPERNTTHGARVLQFVPREPSIVLSQEEAVQFLLRSAGEYEIVFCTNPLCEVCHAFVSTWESVYSSLSPRYQSIVDAKLSTGEILWPAVPSEGG
jgi:hypothetical protein